MHYEIRIDADARLIRLSIDGLVNVPDFLKACEEIFEHPDFDPRFNRLTQLGRTALLGEITPADVRTVGRSLQEMQQRFRTGEPVLSAIVGEREEHRPLLQLYVLAHGGHSRVTERTFDRESDALAWLSEGMPPK